MLGSPDAYRPMGVAPTRAPRSQTVVPGRGGPHQVIETPGGWAPAIPPYITYPVQNLAWGNYDEPPFAPAKFTPSGQAMLSPAPPPRSPMPVPQPPAATTNGPLPIQDWFNLLKQ
jgi:hypothetical protein